MWYVVWTLAGLLSLCLSPTEGYAERTPPTPAVLTISNGATYDFGSSAIGVRVDKTFTITNSGGSRATLTGVSGLTAPIIFKGGSFPGKGGNCGKTLWGGNRSCKIVVSFTPSTSGTFNKTLTINYNDGYQVRSTTRAMTGRGITGAILTFDVASSYDYGNERAGDSTTHTFRVTNSGQTGATKLSSPQPTGAFSYKRRYPGSGGNCATTLNPGSNCTLVVTFAPPRTTSYTSTLSMKYHDGLQMRTVAITLKGRGTGSTPEITSIVPNFGPSTGGTFVTITGSSFRSPATVTISSVTCTSPTVVNSTTVTCTTGPKSTSGAYDVTVTDNGGSVKLIGGFTYQIPPLLTSLSPTVGINQGGTVVTLTGTSFQDGMTVKFGGSNCDNVEFESENTVTCTTPAMPTQTVSVVVRNPDGLSSTLSNSFSFKGSWTWMDGNNLVGEATGLKPGARDSATFWTDSSGGFWLFGGWGVNAAGATGRLNDLWKFDGTNWTRMGGTDLLNQRGTYGTKGVPDPANIPGARVDALAWVDSSSNLWLFGGSGHDSLGAVGNLNDLWKFDGNNWTWVSGSNLRNQKGIYGTKGLMAATNIPGGRLLATNWMDSSNNLWLFGGFGADSAGNRGDLNDTWVFDGSGWTWMSGSDLRTQGGSLGTLGVTAGSNVPSSRDSSFGWRDSSGNFWLFGGTGVDSVLTAGNLSDLWKFDGMDWTWMGGSATANSFAAGLPSARNSGRSWIDSSNNLWLFGGYGLDGSGFLGELNDLWKFDGSSWTFVTGGTTADTVGDYGEMGEASLTNLPGTRQYSSSWIDSSNRLWLFGGYGFDSAGAAGQMNDMWMFTP